MTTLPGPAQLTDTDGSETLSVTIAGIPDGAVLQVDGTPVEVVSGVALLTPEQLDDLTLTPPPGATTGFDLTVTAIARETATGETATSSATPIIVDSSS